MKILKLNPETVKGNNGYRLQCGYCHSENVTFLTFRKEKGNNVEMGIRCWHCEAITYLFDKWMEGK